MVFQRTKAPLKKQLFLLIRFIYIYIYIYKHIWPKICMVVNIFFKICIFRIFWFFYVDFKVKVDHLFHLFITEYFLLKISLLYMKSVVH